MTPKREEALSHLEEVCGEIFEAQLDGWYRVPSSWPVSRDFDMFKRWFEYRFHSMLVDLCWDPLARRTLILVCAANIAIPVRNRISGHYGVSREDCIEQ